MVFPAITNQAADNNNLYHGVFGDRRHSAFKAVKNNFVIKSEELR
jgi:hypothetical protein